jgi:hypothetical protein
VSTKFMSIRAFPGNLRFSQSGQICVCERSVRGQKDALPFGGEDWWSVFTWALRHVVSLVGMMDSQRSRDDDFTPQEAQGRGSSNFFASRFGARPLRPSSSEVAQPHTPPSRRATGRPKAPPQLLRQREPTLPPAPCNSRGVRHAGVGAIPPNFGPVWSVATAGDPMDWTHARRCRHGPILRGAVSIWYPRVGPRRLVIR